MTPAGESHSGNPDLGNPDVTPSTTSKRAGKGPSNTELTIAASEQKKREEFAKKFASAYKSFGTHDKKQLASMLEEQKDRLAYRAKQLAMKKRVFEPGMATIKVGKHYIVPQKMKENERIKHQMAFIAELKL